MVIIKFIQIRKIFIILLIYVSLCSYSATAKSPEQLLQSTKNNSVKSNIFSKFNKQKVPYKTKLEKKYYEERLKKEPKNIELLETYGAYLKDHKYYEEAIKIYERLIKLKKDEKYQENIDEIKALHSYKLASETFLVYINHAKEYESQGKIAKANEYYLKAWSIFPTRYEAMFGLAKTYGWLGKKELANSYYQKLLKLAPNNPDLLTAYNNFLKESKGVKIAKKPPETVYKKEPVIQYKAPEKLPPKVPDFFSKYIKQAQNYEQNGQIEKANEYYLKASKISPTRYEAKFGLAKTFGWMHKDQLAMNYYQDLLKQSPNNIELLSAYAGYLKDTKNYNKAMELYQKLLAQTKDKKYNVNIAEVFFLQQDYQTSLKLYTDAYNRDPQNPEIQKQIALLYFISGNFNKSIEFYKKYLAQKQDPESILNYTKCLFYTKQVQTAKEILEAYIQTYPNNAEGLSTLADIYISLKRLQEASLLVNKAMTIEPKNLKFKIQSAKIDIEAKNYKRAKCSLLALLRTDPQNPDILENLGDVYVYTGNFRRALNYYQSIKDFKNNNRLKYKIAQAYHYDKDYILGEYLYTQLLSEPEYTNKAKIGIAEIKIIQGKTFEARTLLKNVLRDDPENIQAKKNVAISYFSTGDNYKSIKILKKLPQDDPDINYNLAKAYNQIERKDVALDLLANNPQENAKTLNGEIQMQVKHAVSPLYEAYYMSPNNGSANAGKYQKAGGAIYLYIKPNLRAVVMSQAAQYSNITNLVSTTAIINTAGLEGQITDHLNFKSSFGVEAFSNGPAIFIGSALAKYSPNDYITWTSGYIRSLDEIDSYMSAAGVVPSVGPFANQLVGRIIDNKYMLFNIGLKLPYKSYAYAGMNVGNKYGSNSPSNFYREIMWGLGKLLYSAAENRPVNQAYLGYDFYYTGYNYDRSGFGGANLDFNPIGSDGGAIDPSTGFPGTGGYFSPTFFLANKFPLTLKGSFRETKLKYVVSGFIGTQTIQGQIGLLGPTPGGPSEFRTTPYFGYSVGLRYNEKGRVSLGFDYIFNNYMTVAQHLLKLSLLIRI